MSPLLSVTYPTFSNGILTSNKYFSDWGELLSDNMLVTALLDRLLHHAHVVNIRGQTYRRENDLKQASNRFPRLNFQRTTDQRMDFRRGKPAVHFWRLGHFLAGVFGILLFGVDKRDFYFFYCFF